MCKQSWNFGVKGRHLPTVAVLQCFGELVFPSRCFLLLWLELCCRCWVCGAAAVVQIWSRVLCPGSPSIGTGRGAEGQRWAARLGSGPWMEPCSLCSSEQLNHCFAGELASALRYVWRELVFIHFAGTILEHSTLAFFQLIFPMFHVIIFAFTFSYFTRAWRRLLLLCSYVSQQFATTGPHHHHPSVRCNLYSQLIMVSI